MNDALRMQISAFVDGELPENESELLLRRLSQDAELRRIVDEYMQIGRLIRRDVAVPNIGKLRGRIAEALGEEKLPESVVVPASGNRFLKPAAGIAVAASVAIVAIFALQQTGGPQTDDTTQTAGRGPQAAETGDQILDEMFRHHEASGASDGSGRVIGELASYDIQFDDDWWVRVEPKAQLVAPVEFSSDGETGDDDMTVDETETK